MTIEQYKLELYRHDQIIAYLVSIYLKLEKLEATLDTLGERNK